MEWYLDIIYEILSNIKWNMDYLIQQTQTSKYATSLFLFFNLIFFFFFFFVFVLFCFVCTVGKDVVQMDYATGEKLKNRIALLISYDFQMSTHRNHYPQHRRLQHNMSILKNILNKGDDLEEKHEDQVNILHSRKSGDTVTLRDVLTHYDFVAIAAGHTFQLFSKNLAKNKEKLDKSLFKLLKQLAIVNENNNVETRIYDKLKLDYGSLSGEIFVPQIACKDDEWTLAIDMGIIALKKGVKNFEHCDTIEFSDRETLTNTRRLFKVVTSYLEDVFNSKYPIKNRKHIVPESIIDLHFEQGKGFYIYTNGIGRDGTSGCFGCDYTGRLASLWGGIGDMCGRHLMMIESILDEPFVDYDYFVSKRQEDLKLSTHDSRPHFQLLLTHAEQSAKLAAAYDINHLENPIPGPPPPKENFNKVAGPTSQASSVSASSSMNEYRATIDVAKEYEKTRAHLHAQC